MRRIWWWFLDRGPKAKIGLVILYTWAIFATGSGLAALQAANADDAVGDVPKAYRTGVQEATDYYNDTGPATSDVRTFCEDVWGYGVVGMFEQTAEYRDAYAAGCENAWSDWQ